MAVSLASLRSIHVVALAGVAEFEPDVIRARTGEGRARAKALGRSLGRPFVLIPHQRQEALARREAGELLSDIVRTLQREPRHDLQAQTGRAERGTPAGPRPKSCGRLTAS